MISNKELRAKAREHLGGGIFQNQWLLTLVAILIVSLLESAGSAFFIISLIIAGPLEYGLCRIFCRTARTGEPVNFSNLFTGFTDDFANALLLGLLKGIFVLLWSLLLIIPGIVKNYAYSMASFIQQDSPNKDWKYCLDESQKMMKGNKMKLFLLDLSFIGWYLLGMLCLGIGVLCSLNLIIHRQKQNFMNRLRKRRTLDQSHIVLKRIIPRLDFCQIGGFFMLCMDHIVPNCYVDDHISYHITFQYSDHFGVLLIYGKSDIQIFSVISYIPQKPGIAVFSSKITHAIDRDIARM